MEDILCTRNNTKQLYSRPLRTCVFQTYTILGNCICFCNPRMRLSWEECSGSEGSIGWYSQEKYFS